MIAVKAEEHIGIFLLQHSNLERVLNFLNHKCNSCKVPKLLVDILSYSWITMNILGYSWTLLDIFGYSWIFLNILCAKFIVSLIDSGPSYCIEKYNLQHTAVWTRIEMCRDFFVKISLTFFLPTNSSN